MEPVVPRGGLGRSEEDAETLRDVTGGDVHISSRCHLAKHRAPWQCGWVRGGISSKVRRVGTAGGTAQNAGWETGKSPTRHEAPNPVGPGKGGEPCS